jgi:hypothetical protein
MREKWAAPLAAAAERYQVDADTVIAVWGVESNFGRNFGKRPLLTSLGTLACFGRRQAYFRGEFFSTLKILDSGDIAPDRLVGSWAGAFGHTQFMPSTFLRLAVDGDGDGKRDLMDSVPDALASTANFLHKAGWRQGEPWGYEVVLPAGFDTGVSGRGNKRPLSYWIGRGVRRADGQPIAPRTPLPDCSCRRVRADRLSWYSATSTRSTATTPPKAMPWRSPISPTGSRVARLSPPPGRPMTPACRGANAVSCKRCSPAVATRSAKSTA